MTIQADFEARFPSITWVSGIADSYESYTCLIYSDATKEAILNLIAHLLVLEDLPGTGSARTAESKSVGSVSVSYGASSSGSGLATFWNSTRYGQRYWMLTGRAVGARFV